MAQKEFREPPRYMVDWGDQDESITTVHQLQHLLFGLGLNSEMEV